MARTYDMIIVNGVEHSVRANPPPPYTPGEREYVIVTQMEQHESRVCGNCRRWAHSAFDTDKNFAQCAWPHIIWPEPKDKEVILPVWFKRGAQNPIMARDSGRTCDAFLRRLPAEEYLGKPSSVVV